MSLPHTMALDAAAMPRPSRLQLPRAASGGTVLVLASELFGSEALGSFQWWRQNQLGPRKCAVEIERGGYNAAAYRQVLQWDHHFITTSVGQPLITTSTTHRLRRR